MLLDSSHTPLPSPSPVPRGRYGSLYLSTSFFRRPPVPGTQLVRSTTERKVCTRGAPDLQRRNLFRPQVTIFPPCLKERQKGARALMRRISRPTKSDFLDKPLFDIYLKSALYRVPAVKSCQRCSALCSRPFSPVSPPLSHLSLSLSLSLSLIYIRLFFPVSLSGSHSPSLSPSTPRSAVQRQKSCCSGCA